jgi:hypothetical protein
MKYRKKCFEMFFLQAGELFGAFVITDVANCDLDVVDPSEALVN